MTNTDRDSILTICLMAAFADGNNDERERAEIKRIAESLAEGGDSNMALLYQKVLLKQTSVGDAGKALSTPELKQFAYEMAVGVCNADGAHSAEEKKFLDGLRAALGLDAKTSEAFATDAAAIAAAPVAAGAAAGNTIEPAFASTMTDAEMDKMILNYAILNGALELLPQSLASMAIIPLQMKMVYRLGKVHGFELDRSSIKDFLATLGVGLTSQYVEQFGRKLLGGLLGKLAGGIGRGIGSAATGSAFSFASTYALGHIAKRYYAGGRRVDADTLKSAFAGVLGEAKNLQTRYLPEIQQRASTLDLSEVMKVVKQ
jgi:uncharacterized protein (DUF697 family)/uncharacterized tellurite resistance protein B-like protein